MINRTLIPHAKTLSDICREVLMSCEIRGFRNTVNINENKTDAIAVMRVLFLLQETGGCTSLQIIHTFNKAHLNCFKFASFGKLNIAKYKKPIYTLSPIGVDVINRFVDALNRYESEVLHSKIAEIKAINRR